MPISMTLFCRRHVKASQITLIHFTVHKINISNASFNKVKKLLLPSDLRSTVDVNLSREPQHSNFGTEVCGNNDTDCTLFFIVEQDAQLSQTSKTEYGC